MIFTNFKKDYLRQKQSQLKPHTYLDYVQPEKQLNYLLYGSIGLGLMHPKYGHDC